MEVFRAASRQDAESVDSSAELEAENELKDYAMKFRQLTLPQLRELIARCSSKRLELDPDALGADEAKMMAVLKGRHGALCKASGNAQHKEDWKKIRTSFRSGQKTRMRELVQMMLGVTLGARFRFDSSTCFGNLLRQWSDKLQRRLSADPKLTSDIIAMQDRWLFFLYGT